MNICLLIKSKAVKTCLDRFKVWSFVEGIINEVDRDGKASLRGDGYPGTQSAMGLIIAAVGSARPEVSLLLQIAAIMHVKRIETSVILCNS